ncbi:hypothetical protein [Acinetobacter nematophilus]|uniref:Uncharacterized protein n=1 Tax=Acinetobacter nematophilus TaxID=2994642 RepID=A0A9X3IHF7_9GAMM|nr:hypothetical protein [Acinetobacter nematophilus]MCX5468111.1 hypothetical protein [Acinetobacter nematophilus]
MIQKIWFSFRQQNNSIKIYIVALIIFLLAISSIKILGSSVSLGGVYVSIVLFAIGFMIWMFNFVKKFLVQIQGKEKILKCIKFSWFIFHLWVLWLAAVYASKIVNVGLGLPASDFNFTTTFFTFVCYFPALLVSVVGFGLIIYLAAWIIFTFRFMFKKQAFFENFSIFHIVGFIIIISLLALGHDKFMSNVIVNAPKYVRYIAFQTDYQYLPMYLKQFPQIDNTVKIKLHENGVYSILKEQENGYELVVEKIE